MANDLIGMVINKNRAVFGGFDYQAIAVYERRGLYVFDTTGVQFFVTRHETEKPRIAGLPDLQGVWSVHKLSC
jgi:hypothetical protein